MDQRLKLSAKLHALRDNVYYQPPETIRMKYPCILYSFQGFADRFADDRRHIKIERYLVTHIYLDPDDHKREEFLASNTYVSFDRTYTADGLHHDVYDFYM